MFLYQIQSWSILDLIDSELLFALKSIILKK